MARQKKQRGQIKVVKIVTQNTPVCVHIALTFVVSILIWFFLGG